jgi:hypothetical protein
VTTHKGPIVRLACVKILGLLVLLILLIPSHAFPFSIFLVVSLVGRQGLRPKFTQLADQLTRCQKSLNEFLEEKRAVFPRFYFIGDDDLLEILGQSTDPAVIQVSTAKATNQGGSFWCKVF